VTANPFDPLGILAATTRNVERVTAQTREAARQARLGTAKSDVNAAFVAWSNQPDKPATENLRGAVVAYLDVLGE
jgi:hypothetical protein